VHKKWQAQLHEIITSLLDGKYLKACKESRPDIYKFLEPYLEQYNSVCEELALYLVEYFKTNLYTIVEEDQNSYSVMDAKFVKILHILLKSKSSSIEDRVWSIQTKKLIPKPSEYDSLHNRRSQFSQDYGDTNEEDYDEGETWNGEDGGNWPTEEYDEGENWQGEEGGDWQ